MGEPRLVAVTPALDYVLQDWLPVRRRLVRPESGCKSMFVVENGAPLSPQTIDKGLRNIGDRFGAREPLSAMLLGFFRARIALGSDAEAYHYLFGTHPNAVKNSRATMGDVRALIAATDPIGEDLRILTDESYAAEFARASDTGLPLEMQDAIDWKRATPKARALDADLPLAVRLARELAVRPEQPDARAAHDARVLAENLTELEPLIRSLELGIPATARMLGRTNVELTAARKTALAASDLSPYREPGRDDRLPMTSDERAGIARIEAGRWPDDPSEQVTFRIDLLRREFGFVHAMLGARKLYETHARKLFKASFNQIKSLVEAADEGRLEEALANPSGDRWAKSSSHQAPMTEAQRARVARIAAETWPDDPADWLTFRIDLLKCEFAFVRGMIQARHLSRRGARDLFKASFGQIRALMEAADEGRLEQILANPTGKLWTKSSRDYAPMTGAQRARVERIAAEPWPENPKEWPAFRIDLLKCEFVFVAAMIQADHLNRPQACELFKASMTQIGTLIDAAAEGTLGQVLALGLTGLTWTRQCANSRPAVFAWRTRARRGRPAGWRKRTS